MDKELFGKRLQQIRKHKNLTQEKLAELIGSDEKQVSTWERGIYFPEYPRLEKICTALNVELCELFDVSGFKTNDELKLICHNLIDSADDKDLRTIYKVLSSICAG